MPGMPNCCCDVHPCGLDKCIDNRVPARLQVDLDLSGSFPSGQGFCTTDPAGWASINGTYIIDLDIIGGFGFWSSEEFCNYANDEFFDLPCTGTPGAMQPSKYKIFGRLHRLATLQGSSPAVVYQGVLLEIIVRIYWTNGTAVGAIGFMAKLSGDDPEPEEVEPVACMSIDSELEFSAATYGSGHGVTINDASVVAL
jgi:hypothetical protein